MAKDTSRKGEFKAIAKAKLDYWREHFPHVDTLMERPPRVVDSPTGMAVFLDDLEKQQRVGFDLETYSDDEMAESEMERLGVKWEEAKKACNLCPHRGAAAWAIFTMGENEQTWLLDLPKLTGIKPPKPGHKSDSVVRRPCPEALLPLKEWFESTDRAVIFGANLVFDWRFLFAMGIYPSRTRIFDIQNAHHLLTAGEPSFEGAFRSLQHLAGIHLQIFVPKDEQAGDWGEGLTRSKLAYMHGDGVVPLRVGAIQRNLILRDRPKNGHGLATVTNISMAGIFAFAEMQYVGCPFNDAAAIEQEKKAHAWERECRRTMERSASEELFEKEGRRLQFNLAKECEVNFSSPTQCIKFFQRLGIPLEKDPKTEKFSVNADLLKQLEEPTPFITNYLIWKDASTEVKAWKTYRSSVNIVTGRVHSQFLQLGTDSGRSSSRNPNMQNPSRKAGIRECVEEGANRELGVMDYSQMEVVIMTGESKCPEMLRVNQSKADFHYNTAERVLGRPKSEISKEERNRMKPLCFGLLYGMQPKQLVSYAKSTYNVTFTVEEAEAKGARFFEAYPGLKAHHEALRAEVKKVRYPGGWGEKDEDAQMVVRNKAGRRRVLWGSNLALQARSNQPVQGLGADIAVLAMGRLRSALDDAGLQDCFLINFVHDELCVSAPIGKGEKVLPVLQDVMINAALEFYPDLNFAVEGSVGRSWAAAK